MINNTAGTNELMAAGITTAKSTQEKVKGGGVFTLKCFDKDGNLKWESASHNLVVNVGLQDMNTKYFSGSAYTAAWYIGLYGAAASNTPAAADTMSSHAGWTENVTYSQATRVAVTFGTATTADPSVISNSASPATFTINGTTTVGGAFLTTGSAKSGTAGTLFSASDFAAPGDRAVVSADTLTVTYQFSLDAA
jgi:hypothetical protein